MRKVPERPGGVRIGGLRTSPNCSPLKSRLVLREGAPKTEEHRPQGVPGSLLAGTPSGNLPHPCGSLGPPALTMPERSGSSAGGVRAASKLLPRCGSSWATSDVRVCHSAAGRDEGVEAAS